MKYEWSKAPNPTGMECDCQKEENPEFSEFCSQYEQHREN